MILTEDEKTALSVIKKEVLTNIHIVTLRNILFKYNDLSKAYFGNWLHNDTLNLSIEMIQNLILDEITIRNKDLNTYDLKECFKFVFNPIIRFDFEDFQETFKKIKTKDIYEIVNHIYSNEENTEIDENEREDEREGEYY